ncbi:MULTISPECIES: NAD(P)H-dependent oxidoreductase [unclassified Variovorax]|uniref:FMN-dependent NADH-azoreductase n=1 Tax=unclassified Variovorax TaxID=663243 RepID=UPI000F7F1230|nr:MULTISPECIES: NAD(P)H-dependent oxidoreductase [unclassified Variovorax]RSZ31452.1 NAD(P)H dehydrogenase [Variovorax sp. 553]RSZ31798.1 NAD(P)H dehydrogenase [Variovorax sp. 679]
MTTLLHIDASARPGRSGTHVHGSHSRRLSHHFVSSWRATRPQDEVIYRDVGATPPSNVTGEWIASGYTPAAEREPWMHAVLAESDALIAEIRRADVLVIGVPMYNFGMPAPLKSWIDNIVRIGSTFNYDPSRENPYVPLLAERNRRTVLLTSCGSSGYRPGGFQAHLDLLTPGIATPLSLLGLNEVHSVAIEHAEDHGDLLERSIADALARVEALVAELQAA